MHHPRVPPLTALPQALRAARHPAVHRVQARQAAAPRVALLPALAAPQVQAHLPVVQVARRECRKLPTALYPSNPISKLNPSSSVAILN